MFRNGPDVIIRLLLTCRQRGGTRNAIGTFVRAVITHGVVPRGRRVVRIGRDGRAPGQRRGQPRPGRYRRRPGRRRQLRLGSPRRRRRRRRRAGLLVPLVERQQGPFLYGPQRTVRHHVLLFRVVVRKLVVAAVVAVAAAAVVVVVGLLLLLLLLFQFVDAFGYAQRRRRSKRGKTNSYFYLKKPSSRQNKPKVAYQYKHASNVKSWLGALSAVLERE